MAPTPLQAQVGPIVAPLYLSEELVNRALPPGTIYQVIAQTLKSLASGRVVNGSKGGLQIEDDRGRCFMGAISGGLLDQRVAGVKWFAACDENPGRGLPRVPATILVCDFATGQLQGVVEATSLTAWRTGAVAALSVDYCRVEKCGKAALVGFGAIGQVIAQYLSVAPAIAQISVSGREFDKTRANCEKLRQELGIEVHAERSPETAVRDADIVFAATGLTRDAPIVFGSWLKPGATVCAVGSYQEIDDAVVDRAGRIFVDNWEACQHRGNLAPMIAAGRLSRADLSGEIAEVVAGAKPGRGSADEIVLIVSIGLGALDIALAARALEVARQDGFGLPLRYEAR